jgi:hypothetical protein
MIELILSFVAGWIVAIWQIGGVLEREKQGKKYSTSNVKVKKVPMFIVEEHSHRLYMYDQNWSFVAQGTTVEELITNIGKDRGITDAAILTDTETVVALGGVIRSRKKVEKES